MASSEHPSSMLNASPAPSMPPPAPAIGWCSLKMLTGINPDDFIISQRSGGLQEDTPHICPHGSVSSSLQGSKGVQWQQSRVLQAAGGRLSPDCRQAAPIPASAGGACYAQRPSGMCPGLRTVRRGAHASQPAEMSRFGYMPLAGRMQISLSQPFG